MGIEENKEENSEELSNNSKRNRDLAEDTEKSKSKGENPRSDQESKNFIKSAKIRIKFQLYGFFKNLQFFEPFLLIIFLNWGLNLFEIGLLMTIREVFTYLFEIPSGFLADNYGKKNELMACFVFYMVSFLFYFLGPSYAMLVTGSIFYGLGEAFRSGTHKAMEMQWLERHKLQEYKSYLYGITRSWSLYGSALNAVFSILLVFLIGDRGDQWIFLFAIIPFALDFILISTYPKYMNELLGEKGESVGQKFKKQFQHIKLFFKKKKFQKGVLSSTLHDSIFKTIKDYIQPIMRALIGVLILHFGLDQQRSDLWVKMILGVIYAVFYLLSSFTSRNAYKVEEKVKNTKKTLDILLDVMAIFILLEAIFYWLEIPELIIIIYMLIYLLYNLRRPIMVGYIGEMAPNEQRATILSVETQTKSIFIFIMAPVFGYIADQLSIAWLFLMISILMLVSNIFLKGEIKLREEDLDLDE